MWPRAGGHSCLPLRWLSWWEPHFTSLQCLPQWKFFGWRFCYHSVGVGQSSPGCHLLLFLLSVRIILLPNDGPTLYYGVRSKKEGLSALVLAPSTVRLAKKKVNPTPLLLWDIPLHCTALLGWVGYLSDLSPRTLTHCYSHSRNTDQPSSSLHCAKLSLLAGRWLCISLSPLLELTSSNRLSCTVP